MTDFENTGNREDDQASVDAQSAPVHAGPPTHGSEESQLSQAAGTDSLEKTLADGFASIAEAWRHSGYIQAITDVMYLLNQRVPITHSTLIAMNAAEVKGGDREARVKAAWEAA